MLEVAMDLVQQSEYFRCTVSNGKVATEGVSACSLGHRIERENGKETDGVFAEWKWDGEAIVVRNDRYGMYPVFYFATDIEFLISPSIFKLLELGARREINWPGLGAFMRFGSYVGTDTVFEHIHALPPDATLTWSRGKLSVQGGYRMPKRLDISKKEAVDSYIDLFRAAIERRLPDHDQMAMPLSGGRDSRHILFELARAGRKPRYCVTGRRFPPERYQDELVAGQLAEAVGVEHVLVGPPPRLVDSYIRSNVKTSMTAPRRGWKFAILERLQQDVRVSYDGIGGDMLSGGSALTPKRVEAMESGRYEDFCRIYFGKKEGSMRAYMPAAQVARMTDEIVTERMLRELPKHADAVNPTTSFFFWNRTRRFDSTNPYGMLRDIETVYSPFLDHDLVDFLLSLDISFNTGTWFHDDVIAKAFPEFKHIPFEVLESPLTRNAKMTFRTSRDLTRLIVKECQGYLLRRDFLWPRLALRMASFGLSNVGSWYLPQIIYLLELEHLTTGKATI
ncbi:MAG: asparagine synthase C-terminal domain-containing protein [Pseudomonadota bacterium]